MTTSSTPEPGRRGAPAVLRDGSRVRIRPIRRSDRDLLVDGFRHLGADSRYRRFLAPATDPTGRTLRYLTEVDHCNHEAMIGVDEQTGEGVGEARYVRDAERPDAAEVAVTIVDDWQGRGLGTLLLEVLSCRARDEGIRTFTALMLAQNTTMRSLLEHLGPVRVVNQDLGTVEVEVQVPIVRTRTPGSARPG